MTDNLENEDKTDEAGENQAPDLSFEQARASIEALLYASGEPLSVRSMKKALPEAQTILADALQSLKESYEETGRGLQLIEVAGGWQITTRPEYHECVSRLFDGPRPSRLSIQALETLAVIAYRQPATIPEIMELRGVRSAGVVRTLLERKLVKILGRKKVVGHPLLYGTTKEFLVRFGLNSLKDLPQLKDMSDVFGDEVAQQLETLEQLEQNRDDVEIEPLSESDPAAARQHPDDERDDDDDDTDTDDERDAPE
jgi:segregation and condensation protein B